MAAFAYKRHPWFASPLIIRPMSRYNARARVCVSECVCVIAMQRDATRFSCSLLLFTRARAYTVSGGVNLSYRNGYSGQRARSVSPLSEIDRCWPRLIDDVPFHARARVSRRLISRCMYSTGWASALPHAKILQPIWFFFIEKSIELFLSFHNFFTWKFSHFCLIWNNHRVSMWEFEMGTDFFPD